MFWHHLIISYRNIIRYKGFSLVNILGLSLSMSVCLLIITILRDQYSYDRFHQKRDRIYRIESIDSLSSFSFNRFASTTYPLAEDLRLHCPIAEDVTVVSNTFRGEVVVNESRFELSGLYASPSFFHLFNFELEEGSPENALADPNSIILTKETALKLFGDEDPLGKILYKDSLTSLTVTGILRESRNKSHIQFEALASASTLESIETVRGMEVTATNWDNFSSNYVYVLVYENADLNALQQYLDQLATERYAHNEKTRISFIIQPLTKIVPGPLLANELGLFLPNFMVIFLVALVVVILLLAAFNYTSLSIARSLLRAREIGIRKTVGAKRPQIIIQFLFEAMLISVIALLFAFVLFQIILPAFTGMSLMSLLELRPQQNAMLYAWFFLFALVTGFFSGILPAMFMGSLSPQFIMKGVLNMKIFSRITLRKIFLVTQLVFSMFFVVSIILLMRQMHFMVNADMGFDRYVVFNVDRQGQDINRMINEYKQLPEIGTISAASHVPGLGNLLEIEIRMNAEDEKTHGNYFSVDANYLQAMGLQLIAGQNFPEEMTNEKEQFIIVSELFVKQVGLGSPEDAVGKDVILDDSTYVSIIGVIRDYKYMALFVNPRPLVLRINPDRYSKVVLRISSPDITGSIDRIKAVWNDIDPEHDMIGGLIDTQIRDYYNIFEDALYTVGFATVLIVIIASLGLLGIATYAIQTRIREIAIRKVFGSSPAGVLFFVSKSYMGLLILAAVIAAPFAFFINNLWLQYLANHVSFGAGTLFGGILLVFLAGILTVGFQTYRASHSNPVRILKYE